MNTHQNTEIKNIQKVVICSHDRLNENDDTSNFTCELGQQVKDISEFKLVSSMVPLSSYTFNKDDDDKTFQVSTVATPARIRNTGATTPIFMNFLYYTRPFSPYGYGTFSPYEMLKVRNDGLFKQTMDAGLTGSIALRIFNEVSEANGVSYLILYNQNTTVNYATIAQNLQNHCNGTGALQGYDLTGLRFRDNWQSPYNENADAKNEFNAQTVFSHPDQDDLGRDVIYFYNKKANQDFTLSVGWFSFNTLTSKYDIPIMGASVFVNMNGISTKTSIGNYIYGIRPPNDWSNYKTKLVGFGSTVYTNATLVGHLNSQMQSDYDISFSKVQNGNIVNLDKLVLNPPSTLNTGYRRIDAVNGDVICFRRLGYRYTSISPWGVLRNAGSIGPWENIVSTFQPLENINIYYEIKCPIIQIMGPNSPNVLPEIGTSTGTHLLSDLLQQAQFLFPNVVDFLNMNIKLELVNDPNAINPAYYSLKMSSPDTSCRRLELRIDDKSRQIYVPSEGDYYFKLAQGVPNNDSTVAGGLLFQPYFTPPMIQQTPTERNIWWNNPLPVTTTITYKTDTIYTESEILADTQAITAIIPNLIFSVVEHKLKIQNTSETTPYLIKANERLGIPLDVIVQPLSTYTAVELIDVSSLNDVIYISLPDLYQDGKNSFNSFKQLTADPTHQRPIISSIVASIANMSDTQYGKYVSYNNQADSWMRSTRKDLKTLKIQILDSEYRIIDLNKKAVHLELDFR